MTNYRVFLLTLVFGSFCVSTWGQGSIEDTRRNAVVRAIEKAAPAVVAVNVIQIEREQVLDPFSREFWDLFQNMRPQYRVREKELKSVGSGFFFDSQGHILTNCHVVEDASRVASVTLPDGRTLEVDLIGKDKFTDVAVLRAKGNNFPMVPLGDSNNLLIGEWVIAIGNPFGVLMSDPQPTVSVGVVSANHRRVSPSVGEGEKLYQDMIQTDAAINPGNSGGPLVNASGEVVGMNTMIFSSSGGSVGLGFALPVNRIRRVAEELIRYGHRRNPWAGFNVEDVQALREEVRSELGIGVPEGCTVVKIRTTSPAYQAGLRPGDTIVSINDKKVVSPVDLVFSMQNMFVGDTCTLIADRQGKSVTVKFQIMELVSQDG